eukprot:Gb_22632 [translate_table: standard]
MLGSRKWKTPELQHTRMLCIVLGCIIGSGSYRWGTRWCIILRLCQFISHCLIIVLLLAPKYFNITPAHILTIFLHGKVYLHRCPKHTKCLPSKAIILVNE